MRFADEKPLYAHQWNINGYKLRFLWKQDVLLGQARFAFCSASGSLPVRGGGEKILEISNHKKVILLDLSNTSSTVTMFWLDTISMCRYKLHLKAEILKTARMLKSHQVFPNKLKVYSPNQSALLWNVAVRKCKGSSVSHLFANPEANELCFRSISGCTPLLKHVKHSPAFISYCPQLPNSLSKLWFHLPVLILETLIQRGKTKITPGLFTSVCNHGFHVQVYSFILPSSIWDAMEKERSESAGTFNITSIHYPGSHSREPRLSKM